MGAVRRCALAFAAALAGCATNPGGTDSNGNHRINLALDEIACGTTNDPAAERCRSYYDDGKDPNAAFNRLFRAHVVVTAMAELGAARMHLIPDQTAESSRLLAAVSWAEDRLVVACKTKVMKTATERACYPIPRADAYIRTLKDQVAEIRTHPSDFAIAWKQHNVELERQCRKLADIAGDGTNPSCIPANLNMDCLDQATTKFSAAK